MYESGHRKEWLLELTQAIFNSFSYVWAGVCALGECVIQYYTPTVGIKMCGNYPHPYTLVPIGQGNIPLSFPYIHTQSYSLTLLSSLIERD
jgi:hypothetical protein